ncbi:spore germination protein [Mesobacillus maritimus]|uniref:spore germination protein n=1 Tax=Mesobacillus maritimus TaxID=1643336 RepID=UPI00203BB79D|nr:spore germination protein [Mesobacillus maritimus]MCM3584698.1 spore germination protein [Mesobacillus maritimus]MCM3671298.1 spore germination protein [Mesobacillus maritimus]
MFRKKRVRRRSVKGYETTEKTIGEVFEKAKKSSDFTTVTPLEKYPSLVISFYETLIDSKVFFQSVLPSLKEKASELKELSALKNIIPIEKIKITTDHTEVEKGLYDGAIVIYFEDKKEEYALLNIADHRLGQRETNDTQNEFSVIGPKVGFIEDLSTNLHLIRDHLSTSDLIFEEVTVGSRERTKVVLAYLDGVTNPDYVNTAKQRLKELDIDVTTDNTQLEQLITDDSTTPFPLYITTERVDRVVNAIVTGQVVLISDKSSYAVIGPATLMDFFSNPEDFYLPSIIASFFKLIRIFGMLFSIFATSFYVAILTFHFEVIPKDLLGPIIFSRANVPFPPVIEVLFLEVTIDLLREAGARLPTKIGQTLGIVGGIVIGQATVEAALTSNILLIIVALAALSSFTTPIYKMSNAVRLLRYPFILFAAIWGGLGIYVGLLFLIAHLARLKSFGAPFFAPLYPYRRGGVAVSFIRPTLTKYNKRPWYLRPLSLKRYSPVKDKDPEEGLNSE